MFRSSTLALAIMLAACSGGGTEAAAPGNAEAPAAGDQLQTPPIPATSKLVPAQEVGLPLLSAAYSRLYGPGVAVIDNLANLVIGTELELERVVSQRFRAPSTEFAESIRPYFISSNDSPGYSSGTGGIIRVRIYPDDASVNHRPNLALPPLSEGLYVANLIGGQPSEGYFPEIRLSSSSPLQTGSLYHVVYDNLDSRPEINFVSINSALTFSENGRPSRWLQSSDHAVLLGSRRAGSSRSYSWKDYSAGGIDSYMIPIMQITLAGGKSFGNADIETGNVEDRHWRVTSSKPIRERFKSAVTRTFSGLSVMTAASRAGVLRWELQEGSTILAQGEIEQPTANYASIPSQSNGRLKWYDVELSDTVTFSAGSVVDLVFTATGDSEWIFADERNGADYGFKWPASFTESQAQHLASGVWLNANHNDHNLSATTSNWRVVLHHAP